MTIRTTPWEPGTPCWFDLTTRDLAGSTAFYRAVLGWDLLDTGEEFGHYTFCTVGGMPVAAIGAPPEGASGELPITWTVYFATEDVEKTAKAVAACGGTVLMPPMRLADQGWMALALDPTGATFGLWQAEKMFGAVLVDAPGSVVWNDHRSLDPAGARDFYAGVLGYRYQEAPGVEGYSTVDGGGPDGTIAGIGGPDGDLPADMPAHWMTYLAVESVDDAARLAVSAGGSVPVQPADTIFGRVAVLQDPQGVYLKIGSPTAS